METDGGSIGCRGNHCISGSRSRRLCFGLELQWLRDVRILEWHITRVRFSLSSHWISVVDADTLRGESVRKSLTSTINSHINNSQ